MAKPIKGKIHEAKDTVERTVNAVKDATTDGIVQARDSAADAYAEIDGFLRDRPFAGLGIGLLVGAVIGILISEMRPRE